MILHGAHASSEERMRFRIEAEAIARLQHANIVQVYQIGEQEGLPFFSLEFCGDGSLADRLAKGPLPPREAARLVVTLARAVHAAHQQGIMHRDLKPSNILFAERAGQRSLLPDNRQTGAPSQVRLADDEAVTTVPKIADFGLAKRLGEAGQTRTGSILGTP
jgi:serine/threonine-protein kinase